jgi:hypothetical protein
MIAGAALFGGTTLFSEAVDQLTRHEFCLG